MNAKLRGRAGIKRMLLGAACLLGACLAGAWPLAAQETKPQSAAGEQKKAPADTTASNPWDYNNWAELGVGSFLIHGDKAQFQRRHGVRAGPFGGIEDFHWEHDVAKRGLFSIDGRALFDNHDYRVTLELSHPDKGYLRFGYNEFRTWYDGSGGFFPRNGQWFELYDERFAVDRGEAWFEAGLTLPHLPVFTFRYSHQFRDGMKDSTIWGDSGLTGIAGATRGIVPTFLTLDETRDIFQGDMRHTLANTDFGVGLRYEMIDINNSRNIHRRPGEFTPAPGTDRFVTQKEQVWEDLFNVHAFTETRFNEQVLLTSGFAFTTLDTDIGGSRIYGAGYDPIYDPMFARRQQRDEGFLALRGGATMNQYVVNLNLMYTPWENFSIIPSLRVEMQEQDGTASFTETDVGAPPARTPIVDPLTNTRENDLLDVTGSLEARYTGFRNWSLYARAEWLEGQGNTREFQRETDPDATVLDLFRDTDSSRFIQKYMVGGNWYPHKKINLAGQYYYKSRENDYTHLTDSTMFSLVPPVNTGNLYPAFIRAQDFMTHDMNFRVTLRPCPKLTLVSRYDFQWSTVETQGDVNSSGIVLSEVQSAEITSHILSQSLTWTPLGWLYTQGSFSYVWDETRTPADTIGGAGARLVLPARNDYWNASFTAGAALNQKTDLQAQYFYYRADNFEDNSAVSQPYGVGAEEHGVTVGLIRKITKNLRWSLKYGYFNYRDTTSGGHNNYEAHLVYSSLQCRF